MAAIHRDAELAPRDIVARATWSLLEAGRSVYLDASEAVGSEFPDRFPTVFAAAQRAGLDPRVERLPVSPAAHYHMGGVGVDVFGRSSIPGLWVVGEAAATGVHGANRLASNSLLEGLVFGARAASSVTGSLLPAPRVVPAIPSPIIDAPGAVREVRSLMWDRVGIVRDDSGLSCAIDRLDQLSRHLTSGSGEAANMVLAARLIAISARSRAESRGAHFRRDFPATGQPERRASDAPDLATVA